MREILAGFIRVLTDFRIFWTFLALFLSIFAFFDVFWSPDFWKQSAGIMQKSGIFRHFFKSRLAPIQQLSDLYIDGEDETPPSLSSDTRPAPHWLDGPRDATVLPDIIASTYSDYTDEADYAMKQMLAVLETLTPTEETMELFESSLKAIAFRLPFDLILNEDNKTPNWNAIRQKLLSDSTRMLPVDSDTERPGLSNVQMSAVFDAIPFLFDAVACNHELERFQNVLSMIVLIAMTGNSLSKFYRKLML
ncbi:Protein CBG22188 [Caenorhabditis briggsae]|uniref:Protein CBG22188 n=1 Tax=Caenorhabditis briggsae TaxID=6238 RepID=A8Y1R4_CAEBR|nr:Protein CBG22188 [Caenorhabditis briggsae]CAP38834.2 Protein CBG22188 [Caenorhabditis briggsae]